MGNVKRNNLDERWFKSLFDTSPQAMWVYDLETLQFLAVNDAAVRLHGYPRATFLEMTVHDLHHPDDRPGFQHSLHQAGRDAGSVRSCCHVRSDGEILHVETIRHLMRLGNRRVCLSILVDKTAHTHSEAAFLASEDRFNSILQTLDDIVWSLSPDTLAFHYLNPAVERVFGLAADAFLANPALWLAMVHPDDRQEAAQFIPLMLAQGESRLRYRIVRTDGEVRWLEIRGKAIYDRQGRVTRLDAIATDRTERQEAEARVNYFANHDPLTGLPNRNLLADRLQQAMVHANRNQGMVAVMLLDLDRFKLINDSLGHDQGDDVLKLVATRLASAVRAHDTVARLGSDEFVVVLDDLVQVDDLAAVARHILQTISLPMTIDQHELVVSASLGISVYPRDGVCAREQLKHADLAMCQAKELGGNYFRFYGKDMNARAYDRLLMENDLRRALRKDGLTLHYQPRIDLASGRIVGVEALARWHHPERGLVSPAEFIPLAEESGLISQLGKWVLQDACRQVDAWKAAGLPEIVMSVNLSVHQLRSAAIVRTVRRILEETGVNPAQLELEITETGLMQDVELALTHLNRIREMGVRLAIDDFGTGYSSLGYLKKLPINVLKVDQSFVHGVPADAGDAMIVRATIAMAHSMDLKVVAEGVWSAEQVTFLASLDCDELQGFYFSHPLPAEDMTRLLREAKSFRHRPDAPGAALYSC